MEFCWSPTHIQLPPQQSGHTHTNSRVTLHMCRTPQLLSMASSSTCGRLRSRSQSQSKPASHLSPGRSSGALETEGDEGDKIQLEEFVQPPDYFLVCRRRSSNMTSQNPGGCWLDQQRIHIQQLTSDLNADWTAGSETAAAADDVRPRQLTSARNYKMIKLQTKIFDWMLVYTREDL